LEDLEFLGVGAVEGEEVEEMVGYDMAVLGGRVSLFGRLEGGLEGGWDGR
jgi:hypothetical protein